MRLKKKFEIPVDSMEFQFFIEVEREIEEKDFVILVSGEQPSEKQKTAVSTNLRWSEILDSYYIYVPSTIKSDTAATNTFIWNDSASVIHVEIRGWKRSANLDTITGIFLGVKPKWERNLELTLVGERE